MGSSDVHRKMMSDLEFNSYRRYKAGTRAFSSWLADVAVSCGEREDDFAYKPSSENENQPPADYLIAIEHFVPLAKVIVSSEVPKIAVPSGILSLLSVVISLRKEVKQIKGIFVVHEHSENSTDGHAYFIKVLEEVYSTLLPVIEKGGVKKGAIAKKEADVFINMFQNLELEETSGLMDSSPTPQSSATGSCSTPPKKTYDIETTHEDVLVSSLFFFQDLEAIRGFVKRTWSEFKNDRMDLSAASLVTNTAIEIIERAVREQLEVLASWKDSLQAPKENRWIWWVYTHICSGVGVDFYHREEPEDPINLQTFEYAEYLCWPTWRIIDDFMRDRKPRIFRIVKNRAKYEQPKTPRESLKEDRFYLNDLLTNLDNASMAEMRFPIITDSITRAFLGENMFDSEDIPVWLCFALQIVLDIRNTLGSKSAKGFEALQAAGDRTVSIVRDYFRFTGTIDEPHKSFHKDLDPWILKLPLFVAKYIVKDQLSERVRNVAKVEMEKKGVTSRPFALMEDHPLLCGSLLYWLNTSLQTYAFLTANCYNSILSVAHLYNAAKESNGLLEWPDMDYIMLVHKTEQMFVGDPPTVSKDFLKRFQLALGVSSLNFVPNRRQAGRRIRPGRKNERKKRLRRDAAIHSIFEAQYHGERRDSDLSDNKIKAVLDDVAKNNPLAKDAVETINEWKETRKLESTSLLSSLKVALNDAELDLQFDYFSMNQRCLRLLYDMRSKFIADAEIIIFSRDLAAFREIVLRDFRSSTMSEVLDKIMPEKCGPALFVESIFLADRDAGLAGQIISANSIEKSSILYTTGVSLERASGWMKELIEKEGDVEVKKACALCTPVKIWYPEKSMIQAVAEECPEKAVEKGESD